MTLNLEETVFSPLSNAQFPDEAISPRTLRGDASFFSVKLGQDEVSSLHFSMSGRRIGICITEPRPSEGDSLRGINVTFDIGYGSDLKHLKIEAIKIPIKEPKELDTAVEGNDSRKLFEVLTVLKFCREHFQHYFVSETWDLRRREAEAVRAKLETGIIPEIDPKEGLYFARNVIAHWASLRDVSLLYSVTEPDWSKASFSLSTPTEVELTAPPKETHIFRHPAKSSIDSSDSAYLAQAAIGPGVPDNVNNFNFDALFSYFVNAPQRSYDQNSGLDQLVLDLFPPRNSNHAVASTIAGDERANYGVEQFRSPTNIQLSDYTETNFRFLSTFGLFDAALSPPRKMTKDEKRQYESDFPKMTEELSRRVLNWPVRPELIARILFLTPENSPEWQKVRDASFERIRNEEKLVSSVFGAITSTKETGAKYSIVEALNKHGVEPIRVIQQGGIPAVKYEIPEVLKNDERFKELQAEFKGNSNFSSLVVGRKGQGHGVLNTTSLPRFTYVPYVMKQRVFETDAGALYQSLVGVQLKAPDTSGMLVLGVGQSPTSNLSSVRQAYLDILIGLSSAEGIKTIPYFVDRPFSTLQEELLSLDMENAIKEVNDLVEKYSLPDPIATWNKSTERKFIGKIVIEPCEVYPEGVTFEKLDRDPRRALRNAIEKLRRDLNHKKRKADNEILQPALELETESKE